MTGALTTARACWHARAGALAIAAAALTAPPSLGQEATLTGRISLGARGVDVDGSSTKFREDVNLDDGLRVFDVTLSYAAEPGADAAVDVIDLDARNLGGDPFETIHLSARKYGVFDLKLDRRRSEYFYQDVILPAEQADVAGSTGGDFHYFDFERIRDAASLDIHVSPATELKLDLERFTRAGDSTTTLDIERDEFELARPIDEALNDFTIGVQHAWDGVTLIVEQEAREFENASELFLPGASIGQNAEDPAELLFFRLDRSYDYDSTGRLVRLVARPAGRLDIQAAWQREDLDLDMQASERAGGTGFAGTPFSRDASGTADVERDIDLKDLDVGYLLGERLRLFGGLRRLSLTQQGNVAFDADLGRGVWDIETTGAEAGLELAVTNRLVLGGGVSSETRDSRRTAVPPGASVGQAEGRQQTERDGFFARLAYTGPGGLELAASIEDHDIDDPYTLASPTTGRRYRARGRYGWGNGVSVTASYRRNDLDNRLSGWSGGMEQTDLQIGYARERLRIEAGLAWIDLTRSIDQPVVGGTRQAFFPIDYAAEATFANGSVHWQLNGRVALGMQLRFYDNDGSFPVARDERESFAEIDLGQRYALRVRYRELEYREDRFDDYDAQLLELALALGW